ncbi:unnamed protein product [Cladocopium goreaui]|uniref:Uncharacterized protein n=1 Tax=Cladocopium goreaui TaxID=2562237 RepID=A0A9P1GH91_9DINO|nr:unnamed protein product [Cladocopium goreaui]
MRLRRLVEIKQSGKCHVPQEVVDDFKTGGELKEWLEIALLESIKKVGTDRCKFKAVKAEFKVRCKVVKERMLHKEKEVKGKWVTREKMEKSGDYSRESIAAIIAYCSRFPQALTRQWKYNTSIVEYFLEDETTTTLRLTENHRRTEEHDHGDLEGVAPDHGPQFGALDIGQDAEQPEVVGEQVTADLNKFMDSLQGKISSIFDMVATMRDPQNPAPCERYILLANELDAVSSNMEKSFKVLAECMTELKMDKVEKLEPQNVKLVALVGKIKTEKDLVKQPCAELITLEAQYKMLKKAIAAAKRKSEPSQKEAEPKKAAKTKSGKNKKKDAEDAQEWEEDEEEEQPEKKTGKAKKPGKGEKSKGTTSAKNNALKRKSKKGSGAAK